MAILSIIYPVKSLKQDQLVLKAIERYSGLDVEQIIVTSDRSEKNETNLIYYIETTSRASRMNRGLKVAKSELVLFHHPRSLIDKEGITSLIENGLNIDWGAFTHRFDKSSFMLNFTSFYSNYIRGDLRNIFYLDHCLFAHKSILLSIGGFPEIDIFEDTEICKKLNSISKGKRLKYDSITSAIRFEHAGFWKQAYLNFLMKKDYYLRKSHITMNQKYEENMDLNSDYE